MIALGRTQMHPSGAWIGILDALLLSVIGTPIVWYWVIMPYVRRRNAERDEALSARHKSEKFLAQILDTAVDGIITSDHRGIIQTVNPAVENLFGYRADELVGQSLNMLMPSDHASRHDGYMESYTQGAPAQIIGIGREVKGRRKDGATFPMDLAVSEVVVEGKTYFTGIVRDITVRKNAERAILEARDAAERASRVKSEFMANMSHELKTPLNAILGFSEIMKDGMRGVLALGEVEPPAKPEGTGQGATGKAGNLETYLEYAEVIHNSARRLLELIENVLDFSKIDSPAPQAPHGGADLKAIVRPPLVFLAHDGVEMDCVIPDDLPPLRADARRVKQIVMNLLSNAIKFSPQGSRVVLAARVGVDGAVEMTVSDHGIGMTEREVVCALRPFEQVDSGLSRKYEGAGLGLPLVEKLVRMCDARMEIKSEKGVGTVVTVSFAACETEGLTPPPADDTPAPCNYVAMSGGK